MPVKADRVFKAKRICGPHMEQMLLELEIPLPDQIYGLRIRQQIAFHCISGSGFVLIGNFSLRNQLSAQSVILS